MGKKKKKIKKMIAERVATERRIGVNRPDGKVSTLDIHKKGSGIKVYQPYFVEMVYQLALLGLVNPQMANVFGVKEITFLKWLDKYPEFRKAMQRGKVLADAEMAAATFKNGIGYSHESVKILSNRVKEYDKDGKIIREYTEPVLVPYTKHYPPNFNAQKFWLSARQKGIWKDDAPNVNINVNMDMSDFTDEELDMLEKMGQKSIGTTNSRIVDTEFEEIGDD